ncbi:MAG: bifunctional riboflavin kinase/FAD synthetase [Microthrixaceae bacterium]|nr:bifunctional riboflavin kinase/FAD synthetase [Microthrixaceae bacterium]
MRVVTAGHPAITLGSVDVWRDDEPFPRPAEGSAVTIGAYDGVHRGHQHVIAEVRRVAAAQGLRSVVVTFDRHPASVVRPESAPKQLTDPDQELELLAATGVDATLVIHFDEARSKEPAEEFVREVLVGALNARTIVVGEDFHFGHQRKGNNALLAAMGGELGFTVDGIDLLQRGPEGAVSSTAIRAALSAGDLESAHAMLGRPHEVRGVVGHGDARARDLGFRTANVAIDEDVLLPKDGIYAGWYERPDGATHPTAISLGRRPTFYEHAASSLLEAHLLDFAGDLYGETARVRFVARLRDEQKFDAVDDLVAQMGRDVERARDVLGA